MARRIKLPSLTNISYADDISLSAKSLDGLEEMLRLLQEELSRLGLEMLEKKTKIMTTCIDRHIDFLDINGMLIEVLPMDSSHAYLGRRVAISGARTDIEISKRIRMARMKYRQWRRTLVNKAIPVHLRMKLLDSIVTPTVLYGLASLPLSTSNLRRFNSVQNRMMRNIAGWVRINGEPWADTMRRMRERVEVASSRYSLGS